MMRRNTPLYVLCAFIILSFILVVQAGPPPPGSQPPANITRTPTPFRTPTPIRTPTATPRPVSIQCYAGEVNEYVVGTGSQPVSPEHQILSKALGQPQADVSENFTSLGVDGIMMLSFKPKVIMNLPGPDLTVVETVRGPDPNGWEHAEGAQVFGSPDGEQWAYLGTAWAGYTSIDIGPYDELRYLKFKDISDWIVSEDGFDLDGIIGLSCIPATYLY